MERLEIGRNVATKQVNKEIEAWTDFDHTDCELKNDDYLDYFDYTISTVQSNAYFNMYQSLAIFYIHYFLN